MAPTPADPARSRTTRGAPRSASVALSVLAAAAALSVVAGWRVLAGEPLQAGVAALAAGVLLGSARSSGRHDAPPLVRFVAGVSDRVFDAVILSAVAWRAWGPAPRIAALALLGLGLSSFATYVRARGSTLGYPVEESGVNRAIRYALVGLGLVLGGRWLEASLWVLVVFMALTWLVRISQVVKGERL